MAEYPPVKTKSDFVRRYKAGEFGNHSPTWNTLKEFHRATPSNSKGLFHLRCRTPGGATYYNLSESEVDYYWHKVNPTDYYISGMAPHDKNLIQGEVQTIYGDLQLTCSTVPNKPMRDALAEHTQLARGIIAVSILKHFLCPNSYEWLNILLSRYPGHVVEFSTFSVNWGTLPNYNTSFWEVRLY